jgi:hypothetical protein
MLSPGGTLGWLTPMFQVRYPNAYDYIVMLGGVIVGAVAAYLYYRNALLDAVKNMQRPSRVKLRAVGLGMLVASLIMLGAPNLPTGWLLLLALTGASMASWFGLSILIALAFVTAAIIVVVLKTAHII